MAVQGSVELISATPPVQRHRSAHGEGALPGRGEGANDISRPVR
jgi:hypothetical protein